MFTIRRSPGEFYEFWDNLQPYAKVPDNWLPFFEGKKASLIVEDDEVAAVILWASFRRGWTPKAPTLIDIVFQEASAKREAWFAVSGGIPVMRPGGRLPARWVSADFALDELPALLGGALCSVLRTKDRIVATLQCSPHPLRVFAEGQEIALSELPNLLCAAEKPYSSREDVGGDAFQASLERVFDPTEWMP